MKSIKCSKCGKQLSLIMTTKTGYHYSHTYSLKHMFSDKQVCDGTLILNKEATM